MVCVCMYVCVRSLHRGYQVQNILKLLISILNRRDGEVVMRNATWLCSEEKTPSRIRVRIIYTEETLNKTIVAGYQNPSEVSDMPPFP